MGVGFSGTDQHLEMGPWSKDVMRISKMNIVMQMIKKVFSVENGFGMVATKMVWRLAQKGFYSYKVKQ